MSPGRSTCQPRGPAAGGWSSRPGARSSPCPGLGKAPESPCEARSPGPWGEPPGRSPDVSATLLGPSTWIPPGERAGQRLVSLLRSGDRPSGALTPYRTTGKVLPVQLNRVSEADKASRIGKGSGLPAVQTVNGARSSVDPPKIFSDTVLTPYRSPDRLYLPVRRKPPESDPHGSRQQDSKARD